MIKRLTLPMLALLIAVCGFAGWSALRTQARANGVPGLATSNPANGETVALDDLTQIHLTFDTQAIYQNRIFPMDYAMLYDASGNLVYTWKRVNYEFNIENVISTVKDEKDPTKVHQVVTGNFMDIKVNKDVKALLKAGTYKFVLAPGCVCPTSEDNDAGTNFNEEISFTFTVGNGGTIDPDPTPEAPEDFGIVRSIPAHNEAHVKKISAYSITFDVPDAEGLVINRNLAADGYGTVTDANGVRVAFVNGANSWKRSSIDGRIFNCVLSSEISAPGTYTFNLPAGVFQYSNEGGEAESLEVNITVKIEGEVADNFVNLVPAQCVPAENATVNEKLGGVSLVFDNETGAMDVNYDMTTVAELLDANGSVVYSWSSSEANYDWDNSHLINLNPIATGTLNTLKKGVYTIHIPAMAFKAVPNEGEEGEVKYTREGRYSFTYNYEEQEADKKFDLTLLSPKDGSTIEGKEGESSFPNIAMKLPDFGYTFSTKSLTLKNTDTGEEIACDVNTMVYDLGAANWGENQIMVMCKDKIADKYGKYELSIPEGFATGAAGKSNAVTYTWTYKKEEVKDPSNYGEFNVTKFGVLPAGSFSLSHGTILEDEYGNKYDTTYPYTTNTVNPDILGWNYSAGNPKIKCLNSNMALALETSWDQYLEGVICNIVDLSTGEIASTKSQYVIQNLGVAKGHPYIGFGGNVNSGLFEKGKQYEINLYLYDDRTVMSQGYDKAVQHLTYKFDGDSDDYSFSDVKMVSISPDPSKKEGVYSRDCDVVVTWSAPVEMKAAINTGFGTSEPISNVTSNEDKTVWTIHFGAGNWVGPEGTVDEILYIVSAKDMNGAVVKGPNGIKETSCWSLSVQFLGEAKNVTLSPAAGTVESVKDVTVACADGAVVRNQTGETPYLETSIGAKVADFTGFVANSDGTLTMSLATPVDASGVYNVVVPFGAFSIGSASSLPAQVKYTIENGNISATGSTITEGDALNQVTIAGFYVDNAVAVTADRYKVRLVNVTDDETLVQVPIFTAVNNGTCMVYGDFRSNGQACKLEAGKEYQIVIPGAALGIEGTSVRMNTMTVNFKGLGSAAEFVALTSNIAGHGANVAKVAKGEKVTVALTPAENWKVQSVKFNGEDVTADLADNAYTTPALSADSRIDAEFAYDGNIEVTTGINDVVTDFNIRVWSENGTINVAGLKAGQIVRLFSLDGMMLAEESVASDGDIHLAGVAAGTYIITVTENGKTQAVKLQHN